MSLASIYNITCVTSKVKMFLQIPVTLKGKTISLKNRRFDEKSATKSTFVGTHIEAHLSCTTIDFHEILDHRLLRNIIHLDHVQILHDSW